MARAEFSKPTKREAWERSGERCEAEGDWYGLPAGQRCNANLNLGVEYDHLILDANSHDNSLENARAVCPSCHRFKTDNRDTPLAAETLRQQDRNRGISRGNNKRPFPKRDDPWGKKYAARASQTKGD